MKTLLLIYYYLKGNEEKTNVIKNFFLIDFF